MLFLQCIKTIIGNGFQNNGLQTKFQRKKGKQSIHDDLEFFFQLIR